MENYKVLMREKFKNLNKLKDIQYLWTEDSILLNVNSPKIDFQIQNNSYQTKSQYDFFGRIWQAPFKIHKDPE